MVAAGAALPGLVVRDDDFSWRGMVQDKPGVAGKPLYQVVIQEELAAAADVYGGIGGGFAFSFLFSGNNAINTG